jgi:hypothetical protein
MIVSHAVYDAILTVLWGGVIVASYGYGRAYARYSNWKDEHGEAWKEWKREQKGRTR